jgi:hypothetical protein
LSRHGAFASRKRSEEDDAPFIYLAQSPATWFDPDQCRSRRQAFAYGMGA